MQVLAWKWEGLEAVLDVLPAMTTKTTSDGVVSPKSFRMQRSLPFRRKAPLDLRILHPYVAKKWAFVSDSFVTKAGSSSVASFTCLRQIFVADDTLLRSQL